MILFLLILLVLLPLDYARAGENLLINGDAETGDITGWAASSPQFRAINTAQGFPVYDGAWSFSAGPAGGTSTGYQEIDLTTLASCVDSGNCVYDLTGWSRTDDGDSARYAVFFGGPIGGGFDSGYYSTPSSWDSFAASGSIPVGTRNMYVYLIGKGPFGTWINVYFDLVNLTINTGTPASQNSWGNVKSKYR